MSKKHNEKAKAYLMLASTLVGVSSTPVSVLAEEGGATTGSSTELAPTTPSTTTVAESTPVDGGTTAPEGGETTTPETGSETGTETGSDTGSGTTAPETGSEGTDTSTTDTGSEENETETAPKPLDEPVISKATLEGESYIQTKDGVKTKVFNSTAKLVLEYSHSENVAEVRLHKNGEIVRTFSGTEHELLDLIADLGSQTATTWGISFTLTDGTNTDVTEVTDKLVESGTLLAKDTQGALVSEKEVTETVTSVTSTLDAYVDVAPTYSFGVSDQSDFDTLKVEAFLDGTDVSSKLVKDGQNYTIPSSEIPESDALARTLVFRVTDQSGNVTEITKNFNILYTSKLASSTTFSPTQGYLKDDTYYGSVKGSFLNTNHYGLQAVGFKAGDVDMLGDIPVGEHAVTAVTDTGFEFPAGLTIKVGLDASQPTSEFEIAGVFKVEKDGYTLLRGNTGSATFNFSDNHGISKVTVLADGEEVQSHDAQSSETYSLTLPIARDVVLTFKVEDLSGNVSTETHTFKVDESLYDIVGVSGLEPREATETEAILPGFQTALLETSGDYIESLKVNGELIDGKSVTVAETGAYKISLENIWGELIEKDLFALLTGGSEGSFTIDGSAPTAKIVASTPVKSLDGVDTYSELPTLVVNAEDEVGLSKVSVSVNGVSQSETDLSGDKTYSTAIDLTNFADQSNISIVVLVTDRAGHSSEAVYNFSVDSEKPAVTNVRLLNGTANEVEGKVYLQETPMITFDATVGGSGLQKATLNGEEVELGSPITLTQLVNNKLQVTNNLGVSSEELDLMEALRFSGKVFVVDSELPEATLQVPNLQTLGEANWITDISAPFTISTSDNAGVSSIIVEVNGVELVNSTSEGEQIEASYDFDLSQLPATDKYVVKTRVVDVAGNIQLSETTLNYDAAQPKVTGAKLLTGQPKVFGDKVYFKETPTALVETSVGASGLKATYLNGEVKDLSNVEIKAGEQLKVKVEDNLGRVSEEVDLPTLLGYPNKEVVIDTSAPVLSLNAPEAKEFNGNNWLVGNTKLVNFSIEDTTALQSFSVKVNGVEKAGQLFETESASFQGSVDLTSVPSTPTGSYEVVVTATDQAGNTMETSQTYYVDNTPPRVSNFNFIQEGYRAGETLTANSSKYGFFFKSETTLRVEVADEGASSGLSTVDVTLRSASGGESTVTVPVTAGYGEVTIPANFKGWVSATVKDNSGHVSETLMADGVITEDANWHVSTSKVDIALPDTPFRTADGLPLYNSDFLATGTYSMPVAGVSSVTWSNGGTAHNVTGTDLNLAVSGNTSTSISGNENSMTIGLTVFDNAGHSSTASRQFSIDKDAPVINVTWDRTTPNNLYSSARTATITIQERNFNPSAVSVSGIPQGISWSSNGDIHTAVVTFSSDGEHQFSISATDLAGNQSQTYQSERFDVDSVAPVISVDMPGTPRNGNYYNQSRVATIRVVDRHFDPSKMVVTGGNVVWSTSAEGGVGTVTFEEGEHTLSVSGTDALGHAGNVVNIDKFIIDTTNPQLSITGVSDGGSYTTNVFPSVVFSDKNLDASNVRVTLRGRRVGTIVMVGSIADGRLYLDGLPSGDYDDIYELTVHIEDLAGNIADQTLTFSLNRNGSTYDSDLTDISGGYFKSLPRDLVLTETSITRLDTSKTRFTYTLNGQVKTLDITPTIRETQNHLGYWVYEYVFPKEAFTQNGAWGISVATVDVNGKASSSDGSVSINFVIDDAPPTITVLDLKDGGTYYEATKKVKILLSDNIGVTEASVFINGVEYKFTKEELERGEKDIELERSDSPYEVKVVAKDRTGNVEEKTFSDILVTSDTVQAVVSSSKFSGLRNFVGAIVGAVVAGILAMWWAVAKKRRKAEEDLTRQAHEASTAGVTSSGSTKPTVEVEEIEDLEEGL